MEEPKKIDVAELYQEYQILEKQCSDLQQQVSELQQQADQLVSENRALKLSREKLMQAVNLISHIL